jgi:hypothetical protein
MTETRLPESTPIAKSRKSWRRRILIIVAVAVALAAGLVLYRKYAREWELQAAVAEADRLDPGWRFDELEAARESVPDADNSAPQVKTAAILIPKKWGTAAISGGATLEERLADLPPTQPLSDLELADLGEELDNVAAALAKARELADRPHGRYPVVWRDDYIGTVMPHLDHPRTVVRMLSIDALVRSRDGDGEGAVRSCRAALNVGRSIGDEPATVSQRVRAACILATVHELERVLASTQPSPGTLAEMQTSLELEDAQPFLLRSLRAARVAYFQPLELMRTRQFDRGGYGLRPSLLGSTADGLVDQQRAAACEAAYLRWTTAMVEAAKLPTESQEARLRLLPEPKEQLPVLMAAMSRGDDWVQIARYFNRVHAELRCATVALAAERYRLAKNRWPDKVDDLIPQYLAAVPADPFDGKPLRFARRPDGGVIYSVGPDQIDDGGKQDRKHPEQPGTDQGFQLWDHPAGKPANAKPAAP